MLSQTSTTNKRPRVTSGGISVSAASVGSVSRPTNAFSSIFNSSSIAVSVAGNKRSAIPVLLSVPHITTATTTTRHATPSPAPASAPVARAAAAAAAVLLAGATAPCGRRYANLNEFLNVHNSQDKSKADNDQLTHLECHGPKRRLIIPPAQTDTFNELFLKEVVLGTGAQKRRVVSHVVEFPLTRKNPDASGVLAVDLDIKIDSTMYRAHARRCGWEDIVGEPSADADGTTYVDHLVCAKRHILPFVRAQMAELYRLLEYQDRDTVRVFVLQKKKAKAITNKESGLPTAVFSDGIHMFLSVALPMQQHAWMYARMLRWIEHHWMNAMSPHYLPGLTTDAKQILDKAVYAGNTPVLKYGARKGADTALVYTLSALYEFQAMLHGEDDQQQQQDMVPTESGTDWLDRVLPHPVSILPRQEAEEESEEEEEEEEAPRRRRRAGSISGSSVLNNVFGPWRQTEETVSRNTIHGLEKRWFHLLSVRAVSPDVIVRSIRPALAAAFDAFVACDNVRFARRQATNEELRTIGGGTDAKAVHRAQLADFTPESLMDVQTTDDVVRYMEIFRASINPADEATAMLLGYLFNLPDEFYGKGHYTKRLHVGFALHSYSPKLLVVYLAFCAQREDFDFREKVPMIVDKWQSFGGDSCRGGVTHRSIPHWCKVWAPDAYNEIRVSSFEAQINLMLTNLTMGNVGNRKSATSGTDVDKALLLVRLAAGRYCCAAIKCRVWYEFVNHRWEDMEEGYKLRDMVSEDLYERCYARLLQLDAAYQEKLQLDAASDDTKLAQKKLEIAMNITNSLRESKTIDNVFKEAHSRLYEKGFIDKLDANGYLVGFTNGVYDLREHVLREGQPDDFVSKSTGYAYVPLENQPAAKVAAYHAYIESLFPDPRTREYMHDHIMFTFIADASINQSAHFYTGVGCNGKSYFIQMLVKAHGQRSSYLKSSFYTEKTGRMGQASEELYNTINCSFVWSEEFADNAVMVDDQFKQMAGGVGKMEARQMYKPIRHFLPKQSAVIATNHMPKWMATDEGAWRRPKLVEFLVYYGDNPEPGNPYNAKGRSSEEMHALLEDIYTVAASVSFARLKARCRPVSEGGLGGIGKLVSCPAVLKATSAYRKEQDLVSAFIADTTESTHSNAVVTHTEVVEMFGRWCLAELGDASLARRKQADMIKAMGKLYKCTAANVRPKGWTNLRVLHDTTSTAHDIFGPNGGNSRNTPAAATSRGRREEEEEEEEQEEEDEEDEFEK